MTLTVFLRIASANLQPGVSLAILEELMAQNTRKTVAWERHILGSSIFTKQSRTKDSSVYTFPRGYSFLWYCLKANQTRLTKIISLQMFFLDICF